MKSLLSIFFLLTLIYYGCDDAVIYHQHFSTERMIWNKNSIAGFDVEIHDTVNPYNILLLFRHNHTYPYMNIIFFTTISGPEGNRITDTANFYIADARGKWLGKGISNVFTNKLMLRQNVRFPKTGNYHFEIRHAMRMDDLPGVIDAGLRIEKAF